MKYKVKFEFFGKRLQTTIEAKSEADAKYLIMGRVNFIEIVRAKKDDDDEVSRILNMFR